MIIGIDPGKTGGIAYIKGSEVRAYPMPDTAYEVMWLFDKIRRFAGTDLLHVILEQVHASPQMGVSSAFTFGRGFGNLEMLVLCRLTPERLVMVTPQKWQTALKCLTKGDKRVSLERAKELFPDVDSTLKTADALLLAYYGYLMYDKR